MNPDKPSPEKIRRLATGGWMCAALGAAVKHSLFTHVANGHCTVDEISRAAGLSPRGTLALVDGLVGAGLLTMAEATAPPTSRIEIGPASAIRRCRFLAHRARRAARGSR